MEEGLVSGFLVVETEAGEQGESGSLGEFIAAAGPLLHFAEGLGSAIEENETDGVTDAPVIEVATPLVHLGGCHFVWFVDVGGKRARIIPAGFPERCREFVVFTNGFGEALDGGHGDSVGFIDDDAVAGQVFEGARIGKRSQGVEGGLYLRCEGWFHGSARAIYATILRRWSVV